MRFFRIGWRAKVSMCVLTKIVFLFYIGIPDGLVVSHMPLGPTVFFGLQDVVLRHDLPHKPPPMSTVAPHLVFDNFNSRLGSTQIPAASTVYLLFFFTSTHRRACF